MGRPWRTLTSVQQATVDAISQHEHAVLVAPTGVGQDSAYRPGVAAPMVADPSGPDPVAPTRVDMVTPPLLRATTP